MPTVGYLQRPGGRIAYSDEGSGPLVVMVPGMGDLKEEYRFLAPFAAAAGYRAVAMDLRGLGASSVEWSLYTNAALGSDVVALLEHLDVDEVAVIGTSMGAGAAVCAAAQAPDRITDLVLIGPFVREPPNALTIKGRMQRLMMKLAFAGPWARAAWGAYWTSLYPTRKPADFAEYKSRLLANLREPGRMEATKAMMEAPKADVEQRLHDVRARTLVIMGTKDPDFPDPAEEAFTIAELLNGRFVMIEGAGHYPHTEMPEITGPLILNFLAQVGGGAIETR